MRIMSIQAITSQFKQSILLSLLLRLLP